MPDPYEVDEQIEELIKEAEKKEEEILKGERPEGKDE